MIEIDAWLKIKGIKIEQDLWKIYPYKRFVTLMKFYDVPKVSQGCNLIVSYEFSGELHPFVNAVAEILRIKELFELDHIEINNLTDREIESILVSTNYPIAGSSVWIK